MEHSFEDIEVKQNAIALLEDTLRRKRHRCMIGMGAMTDPYIPLELELEYVRQALTLIYKHGFGATLITKSNRILRDIDLLQKINERAKCVVQMTLTTYDEALCRKIEPNVCTTMERFEVLKRMQDAGIPTVVWLAPILPWINDTVENIAGILDLRIQAKVYGVLCFGMGLTLREGNREYFYAQLDQRFPGLKEKYIRRYGNQYIIDSPNSGHLMRLFHQTCGKYGIVHDKEKIFMYLQTLNDSSAEGQISLWD